MKKGSRQLGFLFFVFSILGTGCASIDYSDYRQTVLVLSQPSGAKVYDRGEYIGTTPGYMRVRRRKLAEITMVPEGSQEPRRVQLDTRYRWADSLAMNVLFVQYAPVGWVVDWLTGTAWNLADPPAQNFLEQPHSEPISRPPRVVAIAPPQGVDMDVADALGLAVEDKMSLTEDFSILDYTESSQLFQFYRSYSGLTEDRGNRYRLFWELQADHILISRAEKRGETFVVDGELKDVVTGATDSRYNWEISPGTALLKDKFTTQSFVNEYFHLLPNSVFLNLSNYTPTITVEQQDHRGKEAKAEGFSQELFKYLSAISIARLERSQFNTRGHWTFAFVPTVIVSQKQIVFPDFLPTLGSEFHRWYVSAGYGLEGGYMGRYGLLYADLIPTLTWTKINYASPSNDGSVSRLSVQAMAELGYSYFVTDHLIGRIYFRNLGEDNRLWDQALSAAGEKSTFTDAVSSGFAGISIGYYIPTTTAKHREGWLVRTKEKKL